MSKISQDWLSQNEQEIRQVLEAIAKITSRSPEEVKPYLLKLLEHLVPKQDSSDPQRKDLTYDEWLIEFHQWIDSHKDRGIPVLSEEAMSRESMYPDRW